MAHQITLIPGDGIGPEVANATKRVVQSAGVAVDWDVQNVGAAVALKTGNPLPNEAIDSMLRNKVGLKGPVGTPIGKGFRSVNVTLRQTLDLFANVRPVRSLPYVEPRFEGIDFVIVRENTEDLYAGHEIMILPGIAQSIKLITEKGSTRIAEYAFAYARKHKRARVSAVHKANIMKMTDGLMLDCTRKVASRYPDIELREVIVDAAAMTMVRDANSLDVIVTENLYGDILSDLGAGLVGGLGIVPGANIGTQYAVFEAVHGSAPDIAGKGIANPTALIQSAVMMLHHLDEEIAASRIEYALHAVYASRTARTRDLGGTATTDEFTDALVRAIEKSGPLELSSRPVGGRRLPRAGVAGGYVEHANGEIPPVSAKAPSSGRLLALDEHREGPVDARRSGLDALGFGDPADVLAAVRRGETVPRRARRRVLGEARRELGRGLGRGLRRSGSGSAHRGEGRVGLEPHRRPRRIESDDRDRDVARRLGGGGEVVTREVAVDVTALLRVGDPERAVLAQWRRGTRDQGRDGGSFRGEREHDGEGTATTRGEPRERVSERLGRTEHERGGCPEVELLGDHGVGHRRMVARPPPARSFSCSRPVELEVVAVPRHATPRVSRPRLFGRARLRKALVLWGARRRARQRPPPGEPERARRRPDAQSRARRQRRACEHPRRQHGGGQHARRRRT
jgi:isocitrate dehydrogenase (NAD+)